MEDNENKKSLVPQTSGELKRYGTKASSVLARMTRDIINRSQQEGLAVARFWIGDYELREPDYQQILIWAKGLEMEPQALLGELAAGEKAPESGEKFETVSFVLQDGQLLSLVWDFGRLPRFIDEWVPNLDLERMAFVGGFVGESDQAPQRLAPKLPRVQELICSQFGFLKQQVFLIPSGSLAQIDLRGTRSLKHLHCERNNLIKLDLSPVPGLMKLWCSFNQLTELDLSPVPGLTELDCMMNQLTELDLSPVPGLTTLSCGYNQLTELELSPVPGLTELNCAPNELSKLDLSPVPGLTELACDEDVVLHNPPPDLIVHRL